MRHSFTESGERESGRLNAEELNCELVAQRRGAECVLTVLMPVYNERATIDESLRRVLCTAVDKQVIVIDDGATDGTSEALRKWDGQNQVEVLRHAHNLGKGAAIRTGLTKAVGRFTIIQDADLEYDPIDYDVLLRPLLVGEAEVVYGSRNLGHCRSTDRGGILFRWGVAALNLVARVLYGVRLSDVATCYKLFPTSLIKAMDLQCERFEFCPEVTAKACRMGIRLLEVPISYNARSAADGKKIRLWDGVAALRCLWSYRNWTPPASCLNKFREVDPNNWTA